MATRPPSTSQQLEEDKLPASINSVATKKVHVSRWSLCASPGLRRGSFHPLLAAPSTPLRTIGRFFTARADSFD